MTDSDIINGIHISTKIDKRTIRRIVDSWIGDIKNHLKYHKQVTIKNFGTFAKRERADGSNKPCFCASKTWTV